MISTELQALSRSIDKVYKNTAHNREFPISSAIMYTLLEVTLAEFRCNILKLVKPNRVLQQKLFRGGSVLGSSAE
jgi:hypothetical protein